MACAVLLLPSAALASAQLALDRGCLNCHGDPPRRGAASLDTIARRLAPYRGQAEMVDRLAARLRDGTLGGRVVAHQRLGAEEAQRLMQWLMDGAP